MKLQPAFASIFLGVIAAQAYATPTGYIVAHNLTDSQISTNESEEIGLISPAYFNFNNREVG